MQNKLYILFKALQLKPLTGIEAQVVVGNSIAVGSMMADLRKKGCDVHRRLIGRTKAGRPINLYTLFSWPNYIKFKGVK